MNIKRLSRILICLVLVFSLLVGISPFKAKASGLGAAAGVVVAAEAPLVLGAVIVALGILAMSKMVKSMSFPIKENPIFPLIL